MLGDLPSDPYPVFDRYSSEELANPVNTSTADCTGSASPLSPTRFASLPINAMPSVAFLLLFLPGSVLYAIPATMAG